MTFVRKFNGKTERPPDEVPIVCTYTCEEHGEFDVQVIREPSGEAPDEIECPCEVSEEQAKWTAIAMLRGAICHAPSANTPLPSHAERMESARRCQLGATWTPSPSVACRVRRVEVVRGKWEKPERKTFLDTRKLGEGQDIEEFRAERRKMWRDVRMDQARKEFINK